MANYFFCPKCWQEVGEEMMQCPHCGYDLSQYSRLSYKDKLMNALKHPVRENRMIAIQILGELDTDESLPVFEEILMKENDFYVIREIVRALSHISEPQAVRLIESLRGHRSRLVQKLADGTLKRKIAAAKTVKDGQCND